MTVIIGNRLAYTQPISYKLQCFRVNLFFVPKRYPINSNELHHRSGQECSKGPGDENSPSGMAKFISVCDTIRDKYGCTISAVHHPGHVEKGGVAAALGKEHWTRPIK